ncbi:hypothetical protein D918_02069 [Trichuris suis]|nr:hypothetical protein D918_02069 [Trichuris suis]
MGLLGRCALPGELPLSFVLWSKLLCRPQVRQMLHFSAKQIGRRREASDTLEWKRFKRREQFLAPKLFCVTAKQLFGALMLGTNWRKLLTNFAIHRFNLFAVASQASVCN